MRTIEIQPAMSETVTSEIRRAILDGTLAPGTRIKQEALAAELQVSRAPIRQALMVLTREGLVQTAHRRGTIVAPLDPGFISDIYDLREAVEGYAAAKLATLESFDPAPFRHIVAAGEKAVKAGDLGRIIELDLAFHMGLYDALGNQPLGKIMAAQWCHFRRAMAATLSFRGYRKRVWSEHAAILRAIAEGHPAEAQALSIAHTRAARSILLRRLKQMLTDRTDRTVAPRAGRSRRQQRRRASPHERPVGVP
jgi:DNA-binding GntR family transcriptional regulator